MTNPDRQRSETLTSVTVGVVSMLLSCTFILLFLHFFSQPKEEHQKIMVLDVVKVAMAVNDMAQTEEEKEKLFKESADSLANLKKAGVLVLDARTTIVVPKALELKPSAIIHGAPDNDLENENKSHEQP